MKNTESDDFVEPVSTVKAPAAVGPYAQAVKAGNMLFCSGQIGLVPETGKMAGDDIGSQTRQVLNNLAAVLEAAGFSPEDVVKTSVFLTDLSHFAVLNRIYADFFGPHKPARATVVRRPPSHSHLAGRGPISQNPRPRLTRRRLLTAAPRLAATLKTPLARILSFCQGPGMLLFYRVDEFRHPTQPVARLV